jgi:hypothetical protein
MPISNTLIAQINFSFQGEIHQPTLKIDLDQLLKAGQDFTRLHEQLAQANGIDRYSYLFEAMESCDIEFSQASGLALAFLNSRGEFDLPGFQQAWARESSESLLVLAQRYMQIDRLDEIDGLEAALQAAYQAGKDSH